MDTKSFFVEPGKILECLPGAVFWKGLDSSFLGCNQNFADLAGFSSPRQIIGKKDSDVKYTMENNFKQVIADDQYVIKAGEPLLNIRETQLHENNKKLEIITNKYPLPNQHGEIIGLFGIYVPNVKNNSNLPALLFSNQLIYEASLYNQKIKKYVVEGEFGKISLTLREAQCVRELLLGKTMKGMAKTLQISPRTVETHIEHIKKKIGCYSKAEIFCAMLKSNFLEVFN